jgi:hypothetical protein
MNLRSRILRRSITSLMVVVLLLGSACSLLACGADEDVEAVAHVDKPAAEAATLTGDEKSSFGALLGDALESLADAAGGEAGDLVMGEILSLLGWGGGETDTRQLKQMSDELLTIENTLSDIETELSEILIEMKIEEEELLTNINDPKDGIATITAHQKDLREMSKGKKAGSTNQKAVLRFANHVEGAWDIETQVEAINERIVPTGASDPILDSFTELLIGKGTDPHTAYLGLEQ